MKICFINPSLRPAERNGQNFLSLPVGLAYIMTYVRQEGYKFEIHKAINFIFIRPYLRL